MKQVDVLEELESADFVLLFSNIGTLNHFPWGIADYYFENFSNPRKEDMKRKAYYTLKAFNNKYVCADAYQKNIIIANRDVASTWETFLFLQLEDNKCAIYSYENKFLSAELSQQNEITATRGHLADWEKFELIKLDSIHVAVKAANGKYLSVDEKSLQLFANSDSIGKQEKFEMIMK